MKNPNTPHEMKLTPDQVATLAFINSLRSFVSEKDWKKAEAKAEKMICDSVKNPARTLNALRFLAS